MTGDTFQSNITSAILLQIESKRQHLEAFFVLYHYQRIALFNTSLEESLHEDSHREFRLPMGFWGATCALDSELDGLNDTFV